MLGSFRLHHRVSGGDEVWEKKGKKRGEGRRRRWEKR